MYYDVILRSVRVTTVAVESNNAFCYLYIYIYICFSVLSTQPQKRKDCGNFDKMCFDFLYIFRLKQLILPRIPRYYHKCVLVVK
jgi:hypothetical protein